MANLKKESKKLINYPSLVSNILFDEVHAIPSSIEFQFLSNLFPLAQ